MPRPPRRPFRNSRRARRLSRRGWAILLLLGIVAIGLVFYFHHQSATPLAENSDWVRQVRAAEADVRGDPNVADLVHSRDADQWDVTPAMPHVDPKGFARYVCFLLDRAGVAGPRTSVRAIDGAALQANGFDYAAATRATVRCLGEEPE